MNITIFGDSFGDDKTDYFVQSETSWIDVLRENGHNVTNHCHGGSSLYYSYNKYLNFLKTLDYKVCDSVIFVITGPGREEVNIGNTTFYATCLEQLEFIKTHYAKTEENKKIIDGIKIYWAFCKDTNKDEIFHKFMVEDIKQREKIFYIETNVSDDNNSLVKISMKELSLLNPSIQNSNDERLFMQLYSDRRKCHLTSVNNRMLGNKILQAINAKQKTVNLNINDIVKPDLDCMHYFKKIQ